MKRLILRIAALGTVVVLGLIAIAQAQRGGHRSPPSAETAESAAAADAEGARNPTRRSSLPVKNPLRAKGPAATATKQGASAQVRIGDGRPRPATAPPYQVAPPADSPSAAPSALGPSKVDPHGRRVPGDDVSAAESIPDASVQGSLPPIATDDSRYGGIDRPAVMAQVAAGDRLAAGYGQQRPEPFGSREPARLQADPFAVPTSGSRRVSPPVGFPLAADAPPLTGSAPAGEGTGNPGGKHLEGPQTPQLTIQKFAPGQIQVGKPATFKVTVHNTGTLAASEVEVRDQIPKGTRLLGTTPRASRAAEGELVWALGTIKPGDQVSVEVRLMPVAEGEIGSVATVSFGAQATARSVATKPELVVETTAPPRVLIGEEITITIKVSNPGSGVASGVVLEEHIPPGLQHPAGSDLEYEVGDLPPGESRKLELTMVASRPGPVTNVLAVRGEGNLRAEHRLDLEVTAPQLDVAMAGPKRRYLERKATYRLSIRNPGTASAEQVELVAYLPSGLQFVSANNAGQYEEANRAVHWLLEELPINETGTVELVTMPVEEGRQKIRLRGTATKGLSVEREQPVMIEGIAAILFQAVDVTDPIEVGGETTYEIRVLNQGSKAATNLRLAVLLPPELRPVGAEGPTRHAVNGSRVLFDGLSRLAPKADTSYRVRVQGLKPGDLRTRIQLLTDEMQTPVTKEESTRVYSDQ